VPGVVVMGTGEGQAISVVTVGAASPGRAPCGPA